MPETIITKTCPQCKNTKLLSDFYKSKSTLDGHHGWCKLCCKQAVKAYSQTLRGRMIKQASSHRCYQKPETKEAKRKYQQTPTARAYQKQYREKHKKKIRAYLKNYRNTEKGKRVCNASEQKYRQENKLKRQAKTRVWNFIHNGRMKPASDCICFYCHRAARDYHHYLGYERKHWLDVIPVCRICHKALGKSIA